MNEVISINEIKFLIKFMWYDSDNMQLATTVCGVISVKK